MIRFALGYGLATLAAIVVHATTQVLTGAMWAMNLIRWFTVHAPVLVMPTCIIAALLEAKRRINLPYAMITGCGAGFGLAYALIYKVVALTRNATWTPVYMAPILVPLTCAISTIILAFVIGYLAKRQQTLLISPTYTGSDPL
ncbi:hypothetical protein [Asticcacaulis sp. YBE204]|uniref:hypothetical protein n=1 Tax=Asticcacaulis sp. YBE204 TaxID=1282363 RepID=UPI0012DE48ED|nr:hypothetical protein [Asticcacaulis sp. YBE204]